jgi:hypothetical protein
LACTNVIVEPGMTYHFSGWIKTKDITTVEGISFRLRSDETGVPILNTAEVHGTTPWGLVEDTWRAGAKTHRALLCVNREPSDNPGVRISGTAWVDDVNLIAQPTEHKSTERKSAERHKP